MLNRKTLTIYLLSFTILTTNGSQKWSNLCNERMVVYFKFNPIIEYDTKPILVRSKMCSELNEQEPCGKGATGHPKWLSYQLQSRTFW